jgi:2-polyprenyl-6-methoxyphenol hydroxylase-like FAD-dependent oxidoreductase
MALAYLLARRGVAVTVLEMHHDFARACRGEGLQRSGIDAFRQMGLGELFDRLPHIEAQTIEIYSRGRLVVRGDAEGFGRGQMRVVSQPAMLQLVADEAGGDPSAIDAAARRVRDERWPEIVAVQKMQDDMARTMNQPDRWSSRLMQRLLPFLFSTGLLLWLQRKERRQMMDGVVPVRLVV